jgi:maleylacetate reductase
MMERFLYQPLGGRVLFGAGTVSALPDEVDRLGLRKVLVLSTAEQAEHGQAIQALLGGRAVGLFARARMHTPVQVTEEAVTLVHRSGADAVVAIGGGSTIGLAKAIAFRTDLVQFAIPTTYAGSEATPILGETRDGLKTTQRTLKVLPEIVIYDVELTLGLPTSLSITSGLNAIAHAAEALYARDCNPVVALMAEEGIRSLVSALPRIAVDHADREARLTAQLGAWFCGVCLGSVEMALHHKLCHTLGGSFDLPHAETHAVVLPHALAYNLSAAPAARAQLARAVGNGDPALGLHELARALGAPISLGQLGMRETDIDKAAKLALQNPYWNPREVQEDSIKNLLARAWTGNRPTSD